MLDLLFLNKVNGWCMTSITTLFKKIDAEILFTDTDSLTYEINLKMFMKNILSTSTCFI